MQETHFLSTSNPKPFSSNLIPLPNPNPKSQFQSSSSSHHDPSFHSPKTPHFPSLSTKTKTKTPSPIKPQIPPPPSDFHDKALYLDSIGLDLFSLLHHHPPILSASLADLKSTVHFLSSMGFSTLELRRLVGMCPEILASRVSDIIPIFTFLLREARVNGSDLKRVINRRPRLLASSVKHRLRPTLYFLQSIGIADVNKHTSLLSCSVEDKLQPRVDYLEKIGFSRRDALAMFRRFPQLFCYSIEQNFEPKFNYFVVEMGRELKELKEFPHYFSFSLENRIRPRHQRCVEDNSEEVTARLSKRSSTRRPRLEHNCKEKVASFPLFYKKKRARRSRMIGLEALANVAELYSKMATESLKAPAITSPSFQTQPTVKQGVVPLPVEQVKHNVHLISEPSDADLVDFRGLAVLPRRYVSLLEKACICHPNLAICSKKSLRWREFAYRILGELLFFLTSTRRIEMTHGAYKQLEELWEDAKSLGFDLSWLAPVIESELDLRSNIERICLLETEKEILKERRNTLCCQLTTLTMQLCETKKELADLRKLIRFFKEDAASTENEYLYTDL